MSDQMKKVADTIRVLSAEAIQAANSGHPGLPMGCADIATALYGEVLKHNPADSSWYNRDRFVLSAGHGSMLAYSVLHLFGYKLSIEDLKNFRQYNSLTPGHPEYKHTDGVEITTGPLGQGIANATGMALASKIMAKKFNTDEHKIIDNTIFTLCGDGCMQEGISAEAASLAGHLHLDNLVIIYDSNKITIEGSTDVSFTEDVGKRFESYNWYVTTVEDGNDIDAITEALNSAKKADKPALIIAKTMIGKGAPNKQGTASTHGAPLGADELAATKEALGMSPEPFYVDSSVYDYTKTVAAKGAEAQKEWQATFDAWAAANPQMKSEFDAMLSGELPNNLTMPDFAEGESIASRASSGKVLASLGEQLPWLYGGSADLSPSNCSIMPGQGDINTDEFAGKNLHFGIREHAMGAIVNGMAVYGGFRPYCATFLVFADYMRGSMRVASLMKVPVTYILTHDSIYVGEDGPTHQPIEHNTSLQCIPGMTVIRPADANEVKAAWKVSLTNDGPTALLLTRQGLPTIAGPASVEKGAYVIKKESKSNIDIILMASGSEVSLCLDVAKELESAGKSVRVVSMPSQTIFAKQDSAYQEEILPANVSNRLAVEAGSSMPWQRYLPIGGKCVSIETFGICAPGAEVAKHFGLTVENVLKEANSILS